MKQEYTHCSLSQTAFYVKATITFFLLCLFPLPVRGQIVPDNSLGAESSSVTPNQNFHGISGDRIDGGAIRGANLFHSFEHFNVNEGRSVYFSNPNGSANIFSRVTGDSISNILGELGVLGNANLFLINPNGIIFGPNARLNLNSSFLATTANSIKFSGDREFSTKNTSSVPLLTISVPVGLDVSSNPGKIYVRGAGQNSITFSSFSPPIRQENTTGLQVSSGKTLAIVGGEVNLEGGTLLTKGGRIEVGSVSDSLVKLDINSNSFSLEYPQESKFENIKLVNKSLIESASTNFNSGSIQLQGKSISLQEGSLVSNGTELSQPSGEIRINALESLEVEGSSPDGTYTSTISTGTVGEGYGGDISISTKRLILKNGGRILNSSFSNASTGKLLIDTSESIQISGFSPIVAGGVSFLGNTNYGFGNAGTITINTKQLTITDGGVLGSSTFGNGQAGNIDVNASDFIVVSGATTNTFTSASILSITLGSGNAGDLSVNTSELILANGGTVSTSTFAAGNAGNVSVNASRSIKISGSFSTSPIPIPSGISSAAPVTNEAFQQLYQVPLLPSGLSGNVNIITKNLDILNDASIFVQNDGIADAGTLQINSQFINLNQGSITATTASGNGGNIFLQAQNLRLNNGSSITTNVRGGMGNGGNIKIDTGTLAAFNHSRITADAFEGRGGNIKIDTFGLFRSPDSTITASSRLGFDGTVQINDLITNPTSDLVEQSIQPIDPSALIAQSCPVDTDPNANSFVITGRGGLPDSPYQPFKDRSLWVDLRSLGKNQPSQQSRTKVSTPNIQSNLDRLEPEALVEANTWTVNSQGEVVLAAAIPDVGIDVPWLSPTIPSCCQM